MFEQDKSNPLHVRSLAMYRLEPGELAPDIQTRKFLNYLQELGPREEIVNNVADTIIVSGKIAEANELVKAITGKPGEVSMGTIAQKKNVCVFGKCCCQ